MPKTRRRPARIARALLLLFALTSTFAAQTGTGLASSRNSKASKSPHATRRSAAGKRAHTLSPVPAQGMFDTCALGGDLTSCEQDILQMHQAGMQVAVESIQGVSPDHIAAFAAYAQSIGMSIMWELNDPGYWGGAWVGSSAAKDWPAFSGACGCTGTVEILDYMIQWLSALPATYGYYAADDYTLTPGQVGGLRQYVNEIKGVDPNHMVMVGSAQGQGSTYYPTGATIGNEIYPETTRSLMPYGRNLADWQSVEQSVVDDQRNATREGAASAFILQAFSFGDNLADGEAVGACTPSMSQSRCASLLQYPSASVQLELRNEVLQHAHPSLILWFRFDESNQGDRWSGLTRAVRAPYPATASIARAKHARRHGRKASRARHPKRRSHR